MYLIDKTIELSNVLSIPKKIFAFGNDLNTTHFDHNVTYYIKIDINGNVDIKCVFHDCRDSLKCNNIHECKPPFMYGRCNRCPINMTNCRLIKKIQINDNIPIQENIIDFLKYLLDNLNHEKYIMMSASYLEKIFDYIVKIKSSNENTFTPFFISNAQ